MVTPDVSILLPFRDHEHIVGQVCRDIAELFRETSGVFQIVAIDEGSGDNSHAMLALLRHEIPELHIVVGRGYSKGTTAADAGTVVLMNIEEAATGIARSVLSSVDDVCAGSVDMHLVNEQLLVSRTDVAVELIATTSSWRPLTERDLYARGRTRGFTTRSYSPTASRSGTFSRLIDTLASARARVANF